MIAAARLPTMPPICLSADVSWFGTKILTTVLDSGDHRITCVRAGSYWWDGGAMFGVVPRTLWGRHNPFDEFNRVEAAFNCFVVEDGTKRVLIETGGGVRHDERALERTRMTNPIDAADALAAN